MSYWEETLERLHLSTGLGDVSLEEEGPEGSLGFLLHPRSNFKISGSKWMDSDLYLVYFNNKLSSFVVTHFHIIF